MAYYIFIEKNKINGAGQCRQLTEDVINFEVDEELYNAYVKNPGKYIYRDGKVVIDSDWEEKQAEVRKRLFNEQFFKTSLGYVKRVVTMKDGSEKSFLTDIVPLLQVGIPIITYNEPNFVQDEQPTQNRGQAVTEAFLQECKMQVLKDFYGEDAQ